MCFLYIPFKSYIWGGEGCKANCLMSLPGNVITCTETDIKHTAGLLFLVVKLHLSLVHSGVEPASSQLPVSLVLPSSVLVKSSVGEKKKQGRYVCWPYASAWSKMTSLQGLVLEYRYFIQTIEVVIFLKGAVPSACLFIWKVLF